MRKVGTDTLSRLEHEADSLMQEAVCDGAACAVCGGAWELGGHHIISKKQCYGSRYLLRYTPVNVIPLCGRCHVPFAHERRPMFMEWLEEHQPRRSQWLASRPRADLRCKYRTEENLLEIIAALKAAGYGRSYS